MNTQVTKIEDLGYDQFFQADRKKLELDGFQIARVIAEHRGSYQIKSATGECPAKITGKQMFTATSRENYPAVGDWVAVTQMDSGQATIQSVLPRKTVMKRKGSDSHGAQVIAANIDVAFVVESVGRDYNLNRIERYFAIAKDGNIRPSIILNKTDLISQEELAQKSAEIKTRLGDVQVIPTSALTEAGLAKLREQIVKNKTYCFLGSSGVGKSSLINQLLGKAIIKTENIGLRSGRGKHATTTREMYFLTEGGILIDTPGMREVGLTNAGAGIDDLFSEITVLAKNCKYADCTHIHEPGCAILEKLHAGKLDKDQYANYIRLKKEASHYALTGFQKKEKNRQFRKFIKNVKKGFKNTNYKDF